MKVIRGPWSKGVQICFPGGVQIRSPRAEADHWVFKSAVVSQGNLGIDVAGQVGTAAPVFDSASGVPVSDSARPVTLSCNTWVYPLVEGKDAKPLPLLDALQQQSSSSSPCLASAQGTETVAAAMVRSRTALRRKRCSMPFQQRSLSCIGGQEAAAAAQTVPAAEAMSRTLPPPLFPLSRQASGGHYDDSRKSLFHCLTKWSMLVGLTTWSMLGGGVGGIVASTETPSVVDCG